MNLNIHVRESGVRKLATAVAMLLSLSAMAQASYSPPPNWSPMTMLNITYDAATQKLDVVDEAVLLGGTYPVLAIDTYADPAITSGATSYGRINNSATAYGSFDPAQPWSILNGTAFSRRLGWNPSGSIATVIPSTYGAFASIWIERITASAGLESYNAVGKWGVNSAGTLDSNNVPIIDAAANGYAGIFGTAGSSTKWHWDYLMDHNVYAVSAAYITVPSQLFTATYRVYVGDSQGNEILNADGSSASSLETWTWQGPVPEPATIGLLLAGVFGLRRKR